MAAFEAVASSTLSSATNSVSFTSIPATYEHLQLRMFTRDSTAGNTLVNLIIRFNNDSGTNYVQHDVLGDGANAIVTGNTGRTSYNGGYSPTQTTVVCFGNTIVDVLDYASTNKNTTVRSLTGFDRNGAGRAAYRSGLWLNTAAVNRLDVLTDGTDFVAGSVFALYGLRSA